MEENKSRKLQRLKELILEMADFEDVNKVVIEVLKSGVDPLDIVNAMNQALEEVGEKYESGEYFLSELMMTGYLASEVIKILKPYLTKTKMETLGKIVIGTVKGDIHDIGKNIVIMMLQAAGFEVIDLGVDVSAEKFVDAVASKKPDIIGLSALLTSTIYEMKNVIDALKEKNLRDTVKVIIGGRPVTEEFAEKIGADGYAEDAVKAVKVVRELLKVKEG